MAEKHPDVKYFGDIVRMDSDGKLTSQKCQLCGEELVDAGGRICQLGSCPSHFIDPDTQRIVKASIEGIKNSTLFLHLHKAGIENEPIPCFQFGYAILADKPIALLVPRGTELSTKMLRVADAIEQFDPENPDSLKQATQRLLKRMDLK